jgi:hypothetical protein
MKITRRQLAGVAAGSAAASLTIAILAQTPPPATDFYATARESHRENSEALRKFEIPMALEPAFHFKA